jgi:hypothetical protein
LHPESWLFGQATPEPNTNATTLRDTKPADHPNAPEKHPLDTKRLRYGWGGSMT